MHVAERFLGPLLASSGITFCLFWSMTLLIHVEGEAPPDDPFPVVEIVEVRRERPAERIPRRIPTHKPLVELPKMRDLDPTDGRSDPIGILVPSNDPADDDGDGRHSIDLRRMDADASPIVRVRPAYPQSARRRGIEGRVLIAFSISANGSVRDVRVVAAEPSGVFERAAVKAVEQWRYEPKVENGNAVEQRDVRVSIPFQLDRETR